MELYSLTWDLSVLLAAPLINLYQEFDQIETKEDDAEALKIALESLIN